ncbi:MAG: hypothetical protein NT157_03515 [Candidatus Micrarchaeota archaeon]|nr:hypothetical protein [Candidatus Micrarchaeota archaeon]
MKKGQAMTKRGSKMGQVAVEMFVLVGVLIVIFAIVSIIERNRSEFIYYQRLSMDGKRVAELVSTEINTAVIVGDGYSHNFSLPQFLAGNANYTVNVSTWEQFARVSWDGGDHITPILTSNVTGVGNLTKGSNQIRNTGGVIGFVK